METLRLRVCTWNVGNAPPSDLTEWLGLNAGAYDILVVAAQEANVAASPLAAKSADNAYSDFPAPDTSSSPTKKLKKIGRALVQPRAKRPTAKPSKFPDDLSENRGTLKRRSCHDDELMKRNTSSNEKSMKQAIYPGLEVRSLRSLDSSKGLGTVSATIKSGELMGSKLAAMSSTESIEERADERSDPTLQKLESRVKMLSLGSLPSDEAIPIVPSSNFLEDVDDFLLDPVDCWKESKSSSDASDDDDMSLDGLDDPRNQNPGRKPVALIEPRQGEIGFDDNSKEVPERKGSRSLFHSVPEARPPGNDRQSLPTPGMRTGSPTSASKKFSKCVQQAVGDEYLLVAKHHLMEIKLLVFVHRKHRSRIGKTEMTSEATGIGNLLGNKGAVAVKLTIDNTSFCFVSSHLAAHEGAKFLSNRNANVMEIMRNLEKRNHPKAVALPAIHQYSHIIWMGDLNYRLDPDRTLPIEMTFEEKWEYVYEAIERKDLKMLERFDELRDEMRRGRVFAGFSEGKVNFLPTFKVVRGVMGNEYQRLRIPSYCDRILWHSLPKHVSLLRLVEYDSLPSYCTSDHKPVFAQFEVDFPKGVRRYQNIIPKDSIKCTVDFKMLRLSGLYEKMSGDAMDTSQGLAEDGSPRYDEQIFEKLYTDEFPYDPINHLSQTPRRISSKLGSLSPFADGTTGASSNTGGNSEGGMATSTSQTSHTRRGVRVEFHGNGLFLKDKNFPTDVPLKKRSVRACSYNELPKIPLIPVNDLSELKHGYIALVFTRWGSKIGSSCILPLAGFLGESGQTIDPRIKTALELTKFGKPIATVEVEAELCISMETWIDSKNVVVKTKK